MLDIYMAARKAPTVEVGPTIDLVFSQSCTDRPVISLTPKQAHKLYTRLWTALDEQALAQSDTRQPGVDCTP